MPFSNYRRASSPFAKLIANEDRFRVLNYLYTVWAEKIGNGEEGVITYGDAYAICGRGEVSARIVKTMLSLMTFFGFVERRRNPDDGRRWLYVPTATMIDFPLQWLMPAAEALDILSPDRCRASRLREDPGILHHMFRSAGREFAAGVQPMTIQHDFMEFFGRREGGATFSMALLIAEMDGEPAPSRSEVARRYGLTKSQVTTLIATGQEMGFLTVDKGVPMPTDSLRQNHAEWVALSLAFLGHHLWPSEAVPT